MTCKNLGLDKEFMEFCESQGINFVDVETGEKLTTKEVNR